MSNILRLFVVVLFLSYYAGSTLFSHSHLFGGELVTHSHPFQSSQHSHSQDSINLINALSLVGALTVAALVVVKIGGFIEYKYKESVVRRKIEGYTYILFARPPPSSSLS